MKAICMNPSDPLLESQSVTLALSILSVLCKRPAKMISMVTPESLGHVQTQSCGDWIRKLENRLVQSQVYQGKKTFETARLLQQELAPE
jgi:hypothetical protein